MPTRLYFHSESHAQTGYGGNLPSTPQAFHVASTTATTANTLRLMTVSPNVTQSSLITTTLGSTTPQKAFMGYFCSPPLYRDTVIGSGSIRINIADTQSNTIAAFAPNMVYVYVWDTVNGVLRSPLIESIGPTSSALPATVAGQEQVTTLGFDEGNIGGQVNYAKGGDVIVCEIWSAHTQSMATSYTGTVFFNGRSNLDTKESQVVTDHASYIEFAEHIQFSTNVASKTIKVPVNFGAVADVVDNTATTIGVPTIFIPENNATYPIIITTAALYLGAQDTSTATGATLGTLIASCVLGVTGAVTGSVTVLSSMTNTGENWGGIFGPIDFTQNFNTYFGAANSLPCSVRVTLDTTTGTGLNLRGVYGYLEITYEYTTIANSNRIQTLPIPYDSLTTTLPTTNTTFATSPQLSGSGGLLQNYGPTTIRHRWLELKGNCNTSAGTANFGISASLGGGATVLLPQRIAALASDTYQIYQLDMSALSTTAANTINIWSSLATRFANLVVTEWVSFEYTSSQATRVLNYQELPFTNYTPTSISSTTPDVTYTKIIIPETGSIVVKNSALELNYSADGTATVQVSTGLTGSFRGYAQTSTVTCGQFGMQHRFDAAANGGNALTFKTGHNTLQTRVYRSAGVTVSNLTGVIKLVYESDINDDFGVDAHSATRASIVRPLNLTTITDDYSTTSSISIPASLYSIQGYGLNLLSWQFGAANVRIPIRIQAQGTDIEPTSGSYANWYQDDIASDGELSFESIVTSVPNYKPTSVYPGNLNIDPKLQRALRFSSAYGARLGIRDFTTYNGILWPIYGAIGGADIADLDKRIQLNLYKADTMELLEARGVDPTDTSFTFTVNDRFALYVVTAYQDEVYNGMSAIRTPPLTAGGGSLTAYSVELAPNLGGGEFFF